MNSACHQAGNVRHVEDIHRAHLVGNLPHAREIPKARIGAAAADENLGLFTLGDCFHLFVIDELSIFTDVIESGAVELAAEAHFVAVREMSSVSKVEAEDCIARLENSHVCGCVGLRAGMGLDVGVLGTEDLFGAIAGEVFDHVGVFWSRAAATSGSACARVRDMRSVIEGF